MQYTKAEKDTNGMKKLVTEPIQYVANNKGSTRQEDIPNET